MCSTPKRAGTLFHTARIREQDEGYANYARMLRRASEHADRVQREREGKQVPEAEGEPLPGADSGDTGQR